MLYHCCHLKVSMEDSGGTPEGNPALVDEPDDSFEPGSYGLTRGVLADVISPALWDRIEAEISQFFTVNGVEPLPWKSIVWEGWQELLDATLLTPADCHHDLLQGVLVRFFRVLFDNERVRLRTDEDQRNTTTTLPALPPVLPLPPLRCLPSPQPREEMEKFLRTTFDIGNGSPHGANNCLVDSMIQTMASAGILELPERSTTIRREACKFVREKLRGTIRDPRGFLEHYRHGQTPFSSPSPPLDVFLTPICIYSGHAGDCPKKNVQENTCTVS